ncbi:hypothetical protein Vadar_002622 [Vaccinium darrowii]|uniref:Uncharacterized protein n=1 Tax=Vaccinium darrowii TaxID=229202 RepID=A0ACB7YBG9_9ERIC|nr:hypothetical protein Vadar_002622 [Vaccinium darrowii]
MILAVKLFQVKLHSDWGLNIPSNRSYTLLMGADYYETDTDKSLLLAKGSVPIGIGKNSHIKKAIIDKNARIGDNVKGRIEMVVALSNPTNGPLNVNEVITDISDLGLFDGVASGYSGAGSKLRFGSHDCSTPDYGKTHFDSVKVEHKNGLLKFELIVYVRLEKCDEAKESYRGQAPTLEKAKEANAYLTLELKKCNTKIRGLQKQIRELKLWSESSEEEDETLLKNIFSDVQLALASLAFSRSYDLPPGSSLWPNTTDVHLM